MPPSPILMRYSLAAVEMFWKTTAVAVAYIIVSCSIRLMFPFLDISAPNT
jgi:hypothetical protein